MRLRIHVRGFIYGEYFKVYCWGDRRAGEEGAVVEIFQDTIDESRQRNSGSALS